MTPGTVDDRTPVPEMVGRVPRTRIGDRGSISAPLTAWLCEHGLHLITRVRTKMNHRLMLLSETLLVRTRAIRESMSDQRKHISPIEHARHRSPTNGVVQVIAGLRTSSHQDTKPSLHLDQHLSLAA